MEPIENLIYDEPPEPDKDLVNEAYHNIRKEPEKLTPEQIQAYVDFEVRRALKSIDTSAQIKANNELLNAQIAACKDESAANLAYAKSLSLEALERYYRATEEK